MKRLLISLAHPDDESFGLGGLIGKYVAEGVEVRYICGTDGIRGTVSQEFIDKYGSIAATREAELDCASKVLGFSEVYKLGYGDSGMMGSEDNTDPNCLWQADEERVTAQIQSIMQDFKPQVVITFDAFGGYGHPDHIFMHRATTRAFDNLRSQDDCPQKLYYVVLPKRQLWLYIQYWRLKGRNPREFGLNKDLDMLQVLANAQKPSTYVNISEYQDVWEAASACHASQPNVRSIIPEWLQKFLNRNQILKRQYPAAGGNAERDIFANLPY